MTGRRQILAALLSGAAARVFGAELPTFRVEHDPTVFKIGFGSCVSQRQPQDFWPHIRAQAPEAFIMMGDGVYPEHEGVHMPVLESIEAAYVRAGTRQELAEFRKHVPIIAIWDDNDFGGSDIGAVFEHKRRSKELFLDFWTRGDERETRDRDSGIYGLWEYGSEEQRIQVIVPDLRYRRSEWLQVDDRKIDALRESGFGPYLSSNDDDVTMLGEAQWRWLEECLRRPAKLRLFVSSIQCIPEGRGWEAWSNFPGERERLFDLMRDTRADGVVILSGDSHYAELSRLDETAVGYPLWEATSSGLTEVWPAPGPNPHRIGPAYPCTNFGIVRVNWAARRPVVLLEIYSTSGKRLRQESLMLDSLRFTS